MKRVCHSDLPALAAGSVHPAPSWPPLAQSSKGRMVHMAGWAHTAGRAQTAGRAHMAGRAHTAGRGRRWGGPRMHRPLERQVQKEARRPKHAGAEPHSFQDPHPDYSCCYQDLSAAPNHPPPRIWVTVWD